MHCGESFPEVDGGFKRSRHFKNGVREAERVREDRDGALQGGEREEMELEWDEREIEGVRKAQEEKEREKMGEIKLNGIREDV